VEERIFNLKNTIPANVFYGLNNINLKPIEAHFPIRLIVRGHDIKILGDSRDIETVYSILLELQDTFLNTHQLNEQDVFTVMRISNSDGATRQKENLAVSSAVIDTHLKTIKPRSDGQAGIIDAVRLADLTFVVGPAGTGKTYLAVALAVAYLKAGLVKKIILSRPAVEAGENLGYLPGDFKEKIDPYLRPLYDALADMISRDMLKKYFEYESIEVIPLAYMRGRTLNNAFVILDEAQNSTFTQMKMFLTRLGHNSKAVVNGDITQIDLGAQQVSGLASSISVLKNVKNIRFIQLDQTDVVRHPLVKEIINAYDNFQATSGKGPKKNHAL